LIRLSDCKQFGEEKKYEIISRQCGSRLDKDLGILLKMNPERLCQEINIILIKLEKSEELTRLNLKQPILENGEGGFEMVMVFKFGLMELDMKENGRTIELMELENLYMLI